MRFSLCNEVLGSGDFAAQCALAAALGYDGLEIAPFTLDPQVPHRLAHSRRVALRRAAAEAGITITSLHWLLRAPPDLSITSADTVVRSRTRDVMERLIGLAADLGAKVLVHGSPAQRRVANPGDAARAEEAIAFAAEIAGQHGLTYCLEPLDPGQTNWCTTVAEAVAIVRRIAHPALRTMLDTCAAAHGESEDAVSLLEHYVPTGMIAHIHLNDRNRRAPGQGQDRFAPIVAALRRLGYRGIAAVEPFDYHPDGPTAAARAIGYLRGLEEALA